MKIKAPNGRHYHISPDTNLCDFVLWAAVEGYSVKWVRSNA